MLPLTDWADDENTRFRRDRNLGDRRVTALSISSDVQLLHNWIRPD